MASLVVRTSLFALALSSLLGCAASLPLAGEVPAALRAPTRVAWRSSPYLAGDAARVVDLALGGGVHCALTAAGRALCFGAYASARGGLVGALPRPVVQLAAGSRHACAVLDDHTVRCLGSNELAQLGAPPSSGLRGWEQAPLEEVVQLAAGSEHSCALDARGRVRCWGYATNGNVGAPAQLERCLGSSEECRCASTPTLIEGLSEVASVYAGGATSCALTRTHQVYCWGFNQYGQLGEHGTKPRSAPAEVVEARGSLALAVGSTHACALLPTGRVRCWGSAQQERLARRSERWCTIPMLDGPPAPCDPFPAEVPGLDGVRSLAGSESTTCALREDHTVWCWGIRYGRELAPYGWRAVGVHRVEDFDGATELRVGGRMLCARGERSPWRCAGSGFGSDRASLEGSLAARPLSLSEEAP